MMDLVYLLYPFSSNFNNYTLLLAGGPQVFPLPPGQGFPWAHSSRGKPRRGMMRRAVFSGKITR